LPSTSVVFQVHSELGGEFGLDMAIVAAAVVKVLTQRGVSAKVSNDSVYGALWAANYGVEEASAQEVEDAKVLLRSWPAGQWPIRPNGPEFVVDFVRYAADRSREADWTVAFERDQTDDSPAIIAWDVLFPLPIEVNQVVKETVEDVVVIHLGQDTGNRLEGIRSAIHGHAGMSAVGLRYPGAVDQMWILPTAEPWRYMASGEVAVVTPEFPAHMAAALRIPAVLVAMTSGEGVRAQELVSRGKSSFLYLGLLSGLSNNQVRNAVRDLRNDDSLRRIGRLAGSEERADQGVKRVADWVARELVGQHQGSEDPYNVRGFDTVFDAYTTVPSNALDALGPEGEAGEVPTQVQVFTVSGTWTKPDGARVVHVQLVGAGSGGGSGRRGAAGTLRGGGGGGAGGFANEASFAATSLPSTVAITVGLGGAGGAAVLADNTSGSAGTPGGESRFGDFLFSPTNGTIEGTGGSNVAGGAGGTHGDPASQTHLANAGSSAGGAGGAGFGASPIGGSNGYIGSAGGGGGGAGISAVDAAQDGAGGGLEAGQRGAANLGGAAGTAASPDGGAGGDSESSSTQGAGGGGGGASNGATPGLGGQGGFPGGGGGGGSASLNGTPSGSGGNGGNGIVVVTTFF
jgi:hypothetical protein